MPLLRSSKKWLALCVLALVGALGVGVAVATVTATVLTDTDDVRLRIVRSHFVPSDDQPTFTTGFHTHPGPAIVQVQEGRFDITDGATCKTTRLRAGETYIETPEVPVLVTADRPVKWTTTFILQDGAPLMTPVSDPCLDDDKGDDDHASLLDDG